MVLDFGHNVLADERIYNSCVIEITLKYMFIYILFFARRVSGWVLTPMARELFSSYSSFCKASIRGKLVLETQLYHPYLEYIS